MKSLSHQTSQRSCHLRPTEIGLRPLVVAEKSRCGDLEVDLIIGKGNHGVVLTVVDRKTKRVWLAALSGKTAAETTLALIRLLEPFKETVHAITAGEVARPAVVTAGPGLDYYFARSHHS